MKTLTVLTLGLVFAFSNPIASAGSSQANRAGIGRGDETRLEVRLAGSDAFPAADGKAKFRDRGGERELQIEVEDGPRLAVVLFFVGDVLVGQATTDLLGDARLSLNTNLGDTVPAGVTGEEVTVETAAGIVIASGTF